MDEPPRSLYLADLTGVPEVPTTADVRAVRADDTNELGRLMERAYSGTIDDELGDNDDGFIEVQGWLADGGRPDVSRVIEDESRLLSACLMTVSDGGDWWVAYIYTDPSAKARGLATVVTAAALDAVRASGGRTVRAEVTDGNTPSERLLGRLGFHRSDSA